MFTKISSLRFLINGCRDIPLHPVYIPLHQSLFVFISKHASIIHSFTKFRIHIWHSSILEDSFVVDLIKLLNKRWSDLLNEVLEREPDL